MLCYLFPTDEQLASITYDPRLLVELIIEKEITGARNHRSLDEIANKNIDLQSQLAIMQQVYDFARDWDDLPSNLKAI